MQLSLSLDGLMGFVSAQLNHVFPDGRVVRLEEHREAVREALDRLEYSFRHSSFSSYHRESQTFFNHLFSDQYVCFLWFLSNALWQRLGVAPIVEKLYYLNKVLHSFDCMYDAGLPRIFILVHTIGTVLGKASYGDFFVAAHGCTVGAHYGVYPQLGSGVALAANSSILGRCRIGDGVSIGSRTQVFQVDVPDRTTVYNGASGAVIMRGGASPYAQRYFNVDVMVPPPGVVL